MSGAGIGRPIHAPMPVDNRRDGGEAAVRRTLGWLAGDDSGLEPSLEQSGHLRELLFEIAVRQRHRRAAAGLALFHCFSFRRLPARHQHAPT